MTRVLRRLSLALMVAVACARVIAAQSHDRTVTLQADEFDTVCFGDVRHCISFARLRAAAVPSEPDGGETPFEAQQRALANVMFQMATQSTDLRDCAATRSGYRDQASTEASGQLRDAIAPIERGLVTARGGDYDKGDRINWATGALEIKKE